MKVHLIDGTYELFRNYYGAPKRQGPDGQEVGATRGLLRTLAALLRQDDVTHIACAFDTVIESFRNDLFDGYKTGEGIEPELHDQFPLAERAVAALGIVCWPMIEFETDDALATAAHRWKNAPGVEQVLFCSPDKDFAQCVEGDRVVLFDRRRDTIINQPGVIEKWGVPPESIPDWLALVGDTADGIPGIPRWGAKSAATLLARYGHIEAIPTDVDEWDIKVRGAASLSENLEEQREEAMLYRKLATLRTDVPIEESLNDLEWKGADRAALEALAAEIGDSRIVERMAGIG